MKLSPFYVAPLSLLLLASGASAQQSQQYGPDPTLPEPQRGLLPDMTIPEPAEWGDETPTCLLYTSDAADE